MSKPLTLQLPDDLYNAVLQAAESTGKSPEVVALGWLAGHEKVEQTAASASRDEDRRRLANFAGAVNLGQPTDMNNEAIDADLAHEHARKL